jgi:lipoprotein-anchoring transpeptidase ErfK/SrfK
MIGIILVAAAGGATWWLWPDSDEPINSVEVSDTDALGSGDTPTIEVGVPAETQVDATPDDSASEALPDNGNAASDAAPGVAAVDPEPHNASLNEPILEPSLLERAAVYVREHKPVQARAVLSAALLSGTLAPSEADHVRATLSALNQGLVFSKELAAGDPHVGLYTIKPGDSLSRIVDREDLPINWRFLQSLNGIADPSRIGVGQRLKTIISPFHATVDKSAHRLDLWLGEGDDVVFVRSFAVGLGDFDSTPQGIFRVKKGGKLVNPSWRNPRTGKYYGADDPKNPIGEFWITLEGIEPHNEQEEGFGVHGTIDPSSIGQSRSMGCVRLGDADIAMLYGLLAQGKSTVTVN